MTTELHPCARCAQLQRTCCQRAEILLTGGDAARIREHTARDDFLEWRVPDDPSYLEPDPADPEWLELAVAEGGRRRVLTREPNGDCVFLGERGCVLPLETRPLVCRLYPFAYTADGLVDEAAGYCPAGLLRWPGDSMLDVLAMSRQDGERWRSQLYSELRSDARASGGVR